MFEFKDKWGVTVKIDDSQESVNAVFEAVVNWFKKYQCYSGEEIMQDDECLLNAPELLADIADDTLKFEFED